MAKGMNWDKVRNDRLVRERGYDSIRPPKVRTLKAKPRPGSKPKQKGNGREPTQRRTLQTLSGPVSYVDSGWSESEWRMIAAAMSRYQRAAVRF